MVITPVVYVAMHGQGLMGCGAMGVDKLKFSGPKIEAMRVMGSFGSFLKLAGAVPGNKGATCPK